MKPYVLECCVDSVESAVIATRAGANRLELCSNLIIGGTTPTLALYEQVKKACSNVIHVLIRPRFGDFCYSAEEFQVIQKEVEQFRKAGADGVVIGILTPQGDIDQERMKQLIESAGEMTVTLHRAFDMVRDPKQALLTAIGLGLQSILTSGQENTCLLGKQQIKEFIAASHNQIEILVGSGVKSDNLKELMDSTGASAYHMSGKQVIDSQMQYKNPRVKMGLDVFDEYSVWRADEQEIQAAVKILEQAFCKSF